MAPKLSDFCGNDDFSITWGELVRGKGRCGLSLLSALLPTAYVLLLWVGYLSAWLRARKRRNRRGISKRANGNRLLAKDTALNGFLGGGAGVQAGGDEGDEGDAGFGNGAEEPLLSATASTLGVTGDWRRSDDNEEGSNDPPLGDEPYPTVKKGNGLHWGKLLLYWTQIGYHLTVAAYSAFNSGNGDYKYALNAMLGGAWIFFAWIEVLQYLLPSRRNSPFQAAFPVLCLSFSLWELIQFNGIGGIKISQLAVWDVCLLVIISWLDVLSVTRLTPVKYYQHLSAEYSASLWSYWNFSWYTRIVDLGYKQILTVEDLDVLVDDDRSETVWGRFTRLLYPRGEENVQEGEELRVGRNVVRLGGQRYFLQAAVALIAAMTQLAPPLALFQITNYMTEHDKDSNKDVPLKVLVCVAALFLGQVVSNYCDTLMFKIGRRLGIRARSALISAVFRKALRLDMSAANAGQLQNLISVDAESVLNLMVFQMFMWGAFLRLLAVIILLFWVLGVSAISGLSLVFLTLPINKVLVGRLKAYQLQLMAKKDVRMTTINESIQGIRIIKLFGWEPKFISKIEVSRQLELVILRGYMFTLGSFMVAIKSSPTLIGLVTFLVHTQAFGYELTAAAGFTALALFNQLRMPLIVLPDTFNYYIQAKVSFDRVGRFLSSNGSDVRNEAVFGTGGSDRQSPLCAKGEIKVEGATFRWRTLDPMEPPTLSDVNLHIKPGKLTCIYGPTGSGKSSLLMAMLQELVTTSGRCLMNGRVAFASQKAWIQNATLRDNITFGSPFERGKYDRVLEACALKSDLDTLEGGDMTEIGEKGVNLSGGQQQRVSLARAVYNDADILLMDDVLSAVDAHVGKHIFDKCMRRYLGGKTRVLVTHQVSLTARYADEIIVLNADGSVRERGTYQELTKSTEGGESHLAEVILSASGATRLQRQSSAASVGETERGAVGDDGGKGGNQQPEKPGAMPGGGAAADGGAAGGQGRGGDKLSGSGSKIIEEERRAIGRPKAGLFLTYFRFCGGVWFGVAWVVLSLLWQGLNLAQSFFLKDWINELAAGVDDGKGMWKFVAVSVLSFSTLLVRTVVITWGSLRASRQVHERMTERVFRAPVGWFDATPLGRIFNRFSSDIVTLDKDLMNDLSSYSDTLLGVMGVLVVIIVAIPVFTVGLIPVMMLVLYYAERYLQTSRQLKRLEAVNRSPLYAHFSESVSGVATIRGYGAEQRFIRRNQQHTDHLNRSHFFLWASNYWLSNKVRNIGALVCGVVGVFLIARVDSIDGATAGLVLTYSLQFTLTVVFTVRSHAQMEMSVNSIERLDEYCRLPQEADWIIEDHQPPPSWPSGGEVAVSNLSLQYASSSEPVLHGVSFFVPARTRMGCVGRTGAGKSSLMTALFRLVEPMEGTSIEIDGINVLKMGLHDLRKRLAIIPQDPTLFEGTVRSNVDPFGEYSDTLVWEALGDCHMKEFVRSTPKKLEHEVAEGGGNLSVGQRQLLCMCRAMLRKASVLVMDEATANVDSETDVAIQDTIRTGFADCTILCIAHRLNTVCHYDKVLVLDKGRVAEYDAPLKLISDPDSMFRGMCESSGELDNLIRIAQESADQRQREGAGH